MSSPLEQNIINLQDILNKVNELPKSGNSNVNVGDALNFTIVGGTTTPTNPTQNTIWVNTDAEITSWMFSIAEPASPTSGMVWIQTGASSTIPFNALRSNSLYAYPIYVSQYVGNFWIAKEANIYQNGKWMGMWNGTIFDNGTIYNDISYTTSTTGAGHIYVGEEYIGFWSDTAEGGGTGRVSFGAIDITGFKTLTVTGSGDQLGVGIDAWIADSPGSTTRIAGGSTSAPAGGSATLTMDISSVSTNTPLYVVVQLANYATLGTNGYIYHVKLNR